MSRPPVVITFDVENRESAQIECEYAVVLEAPQVEVITIGGQGPPGRQGIPGPDGGAALQRQAGEVLSALTAVYELNGRVFALDQADSEHIDFMLGVALTAAETGLPLNIQRSGAIDDATWDWSPGPVWLGPAGSLTQIPPVTGFDLLVGTAVSEKRLILNLQEPIELE